MAAQPAASLINGAENLDGPDASFNGHSWTGTTYAPPIPKPAAIARTVRETLPAPAPAAVNAPHSLFEVFARMAADPSIPIDRLKQLMEMQEQAEAREAEREFNAAFARLVFPPIGKTARGKNSNYAPYEEVQSVITPILQAQGFSLSFSSAEPGEKDIPIHGTLAHVAGHSRIGTIYVPRDKSGSMNEIQGMGSSTSYGMRYLAKMMLNLRFIGEDNDGAALRPNTVTKEQAATIREMFTRCNMDKLSQAGFFKAMEVQSVSEILQTEFPRAMSLLNLKLRKTQATNGGAM